MSGRRYYTQDEIAQAKTYLSDELEPAAHETGYKFVCPFCRQATISKLMNDGTRFICNRREHCGKTGDIFDVVRIRDNIPSALETFHVVMERYIDGAPDHHHQPPRERSEARAKQARTKLETERPTTNYSRYLRRCAAQLEGSDGEVYLRTRGFTLRTMKRYKLGYDAQCRIANGHPAIILPYSSEFNYYAARVIDEWLDGDGRPQRYRKAAGEEPIYHGAALSTYQNVIVCEGQLDALAFAQAANDASLTLGAVAIGNMGGTAAADRLANILDYHGSRPRLILALDNEDAARRSMESMSDRLIERGIVHALADTHKLYHGRKDAAELLQYDAQALAGELAALMAELDLTDEAF